MAAGDLTTLASVRKFLGKPAADTGTDSLLTDLITEASALIHKEAERQFAPTETATPHTFEYDGTRFLSLAPYDLRSSAPTVQIDTGAGETPRTLTANEYRLFPQPAPDGVFTAIRLYPYGPGSGRWAERLVTITGDWGFPGVPADVAHWANVTVAVWYRRDAAALETTFRLDEERIEHPKSLPSAVQAGLDKYRRWTA